MTLKTVALPEDLGYKIQVISPSTDSNYALQWVQSLLLVISERLPNARPCTIFLSPAGGRLLQMFNGQTGNMLQAFQGSETDALGYLWGCMVRANTEFSEVSDVCLVCENTEDRFRVAFQSQYAS